MMALLIALAILGVIGGAAGFHYARIERARKRSNTAPQLELPYTRENDDTGSQAFAR